MSAVSNRSCSALTDPNAVYSVRTRPARKATFRCRQSPTQLRCRQQTAASTLDQVDDVGVGNSHAVRAPVLRVDLLRILLGSATLIEDVCQLPGSTPSWYSLLPCATTDVTRWLQVDGTAQDVLASRRAALLGLSAGFVSSLTLQDAAPAYARDVKEVCPQAAHAQPGSVFERL